MRSLLAVMAFGLAVAAHGESRVVFGSFESAWYAERQATAVADALDIVTEVVSFDAGGLLRHRVVGPVLPEAEARALRDVAVRRDWPGAWLLHGVPAAVAAAPPPRESSVDRPTPDVPVAEPAGPAEDAGPADLAGRGLTLRSAADLTEAIVVPRYADRDLDVVLDGVLDEAVWAETPGYDGMRVIQPDTLVEPRYRTVVRYLYTERGLYVGAWMEQPPETLLARLSSRDEHINRDNFGITLDTSGEGLYGFWFTINLGGTVMDGKVEPERQFTVEWDGPWESATAELSDGWSAEVFLPWSMLSMPAVTDDREMGIWVDRQVAHIDERWSWPALPFTAARFLSAFGRLKVPGVAPRQELSLFPYASATFDQVGNDEEANVGLDVFWRPSTAFQVTGAVNPDFGAVESDDVVINLTARETYFPEKRLFFL
ncbi:MAG: hypothetical protein F4X99_15755, partial [Gammaproteobacteria bacterium]|nr:hypothetical protein [Gammaproteobacteria bacterium]